MGKNDVYWWSEAPLRPMERQPVPPAADVVIVGAGYTGLSAAIRLARAGRSVHVFDKQDPGEGASTRNGGITSGNLRPGTADLTRRFGAERRRRLSAKRSHRQAQSGVRFERGRRAVRARPGSDESFRHDRHLPPARFK